MKAEKLFAEERAVTMWLRNEMAEEKKKYEESIGVM